VSFTDDGSAIAGCTGLSLPVYSSPGAVSCATNPQAGDVTITADYSGDNNYGGSSGSVQDDVSLAPLTVTADSQSEHSSEKDHLVRLSVTTCSGLKVTGFGGGAVGLLGDLLSLILFYMIVAGWCCHWGLGGRTGKRLMGGHGSWGGWGGSEADGTVLTVRR
jgi:hypothetical protein